MKVFTTDQTKILKYHKGLKQEGTLSLSTRVTIQGNYLKGSVPVFVKYVANFCPDEKYWEVDGNYPDDEPYSITYPKEYDSETDRVYYIKTHFKDV